jgi:hypothetical protein
MRLRTSRGGRAVCRGVRAPSLYLRTGYRPPMSTSVGAARALAAASGFTSPGWAPARHQAPRRRGARPLARRALAPRLATPPGGTRTAERCRCLASEVSPGAGQRGAGGDASGPACASLCFALMAGIRRGARAIGSAGERLVHTEEVTGSIPVSPTQVGRGLARRYAATPRPRQSFTGGSRNSRTELAQRVRSSAAFALRAARDNWLDSMTDKPAKTSAPTARCPAGPRPRSVASDARRLRTHWPVCMPVAHDETAR